jgi:hypothetical protein
MGIQRKHGITFVCAECGAALYHAGPRSSKDELLVQPSEFIAKLKSCPTCGHKLKEPADADAMRIARAAVSSNHQRLHEAIEMLAS